jgi:hypothetical protein
MKRNSLISFLIGVMVMASFWGCSERLKYTYFVSADPQLNIVAEYPQGWLERLQKGADYAQALFLEPKRQDKIFKAGMVVTRKEVGVFALEAARDDLLKKRMQFKEARLLSQKAKRVLGLAAEEMLLSYQTLDQISNRATAKLIAVKERITIFKKGASCYIVRYQNTAEEFKQFEGAYLHLLRTLKID